MFEYFFQFSDWNFLGQKLFKDAKRSLKSLKIFKIWRSLKTFIQSFNGFFILMNNPKIFKNLLRIFIKALEFTVFNNL